MADPITGAALAKAALAGGKLAIAVKQKLEAISNTAKLLEAMAVDARSWRAGRDIQVEQRLEALVAAAKDQQAFCERVVAMFDDLQFQRLHLSLEFEALREATDTRREMLKYAAAGLSDPDLSLDDKARAERALRQLDEVDVLRLAEFDARRGARGTLGQLNVDGLVTAGCVRLDPTNSRYGERDGPTLQVFRLELTATGHLLVNVMSWYVQVVKAKAASPAEPQ
jgi:hypothetical protein